MKIITPIFVKIFSALILFTALSNTAFGDIVLDSGTINAQAASGGGFLAGTSTFDLTGLNPSDVELIANFDLIDAGTEIRVNGVSLFPLFDDVSQFSRDLVYADTGVTRESGDGEGNINNPFDRNSNGLPRLTVNSLSNETMFSGAAFDDSIATIAYIPNFEVQDFSSLLNSDGVNTIEFFVLNNFQGARLEGDYTVTLIESTAAVPEPSVFGFGLLALAGLVSRRRR